MTKLTMKRAQEWLIASLIRAIRTAAQAAVSLIGTNAMGITDIDWVAVASAAALAAVVSVLMAVAGLPEVNQGENLPSIVSGPGGNHAA